jgi:hypothetical protein
MQISRPRLFTLLARGVTRNKKLVALGTEIERGCKRGSRNGARSLRLRLAHHRSVPSCEQHVEERQVGRLELFAPVRDHGWEEALIPRRSRASVFGVVVFFSLIPHNARQPHRSEWRNHSLEVPAAGRCDVATWGRVRRGKAGQGKTRRGGAGEAGQFEAGRAKGNKSVFRARIMYGKPVLQALKANMLAQVLIRVGRQCWPTVGTSGQF